MTGWNICKESKFKRTKIPIKKEQIKENFEIITRDHQINIMQPKFASDWIWQLVSATS